jgi:hypothetical protein
MINNITTIYKIKGIKYKLEYCVYFALMKCVASFPIYFTAIAIVQHCTTLPFAEGSKQQLDPYIDNQFITCRRRSKVRVMKEMER